MSRTGNAVDRLIGIWVANFMAWLKHDAEAPPSKICLGLVSPHGFGQGASMHQAATELSIATPGQGLHDFTQAVTDWVAAQGVATGLLTLFVRHTSCSLLIQENAAPAARRDVERYFARIAPESAGYEHDDEGPDDMPAHLRAALTATSLSIPVMDSEIALGTWQGIYLFEHRHASHRRRVAVHLFGD